jgi:hypothetical protein
MFQSGRPTPASGVAVPAGSLPNAKVRATDGRPKGGMRREVGESGHLYAGEIVEASIIVML